MNRPAGGPVPAGFWRRALAYGLDWLLLGLLLLWLLAPALAVAWSALAQLHSTLQDWLLSRLLSGPSLPSPLDLAQSALQDASLRAAIDSLVARITLTLAKAAVLVIGLAALYFIGFEASAWQATPGKRLLGIRVSDLDGHRISVGQSSARFLAGSVSWLSMNLGHALAGWRADGRALHDLIAGTRVNRIAAAQDQTAI